MENAILKTSTNCEGGSGSCVKTRSRAIKFCEHRDCAIISQTSNEGWLKVNPESVSITMGTSTETNYNEILHFLKITVG